MNKLDSLPRGQALDKLDALIRHQANLELLNRAIPDKLNTFERLRTTESEREHRRENWTIGNYLKAGFFNGLIRRTLISAALSWLLCIVLGAVYTIVKEAKAVESGTAPDEVSIAFAALLLLIGGAFFVFTWCIQWVRPCQKQQKEDRDPVTTANNRQRIGELYDNLTEIYKAYEKISSALDGFYSRHYVKDRFKNSDMLRALRKKYTHPSLRMQEAIKECEDEADAIAAREYYSNLQNSIESHMQESHKIMSDYARQQLDEQRRQNDLDYQRNEYLRRMEDHLRYHH